MFTCSLIKRRPKPGLVKVRLSWTFVVKWFTWRRGGGVPVELTNSGMHLLMACWTVGPTSKCYCLGPEIPPSINIQAIKILATDRWIFILLFEAWATKNWTRSQVSQVSVSTVPKSGFISKHIARSRFRKKIHQHLKNTHSVRHTMHDTSSKIHWFVLHGP